MQSATCSLPSRLINLLTGQSKVKKLRLPKFSIFLKLILIVLLFGVIVDVAVLLVIRFSTNREPGLMHKSEKVLLTMLGTPPDTNKIKKVGDDMGWYIRYQAPGYDWATNGSVPKIEEIQTSPGFSERIAHDDYFPFSYKSRFYLIFKSANGFFIVQPINPRDIFDEQRAIISLVILLSIIIISLYFLIRRLFRPLKFLIAAVHQVGNGNYYLDIPVKRKDELGELAESISSMASKIGNSIKAKEQLLLDVSHELRTPLTRMKLGLAVGSPTEKINDDVNEMERMIAGLLESYRSEESTVTNLKPAKVDVVELIRDTIDEYTAHDRIKFSDPGKNIELFIDEEKIQIVLRNIITNALKYSRQEAEIKIEEDDKLVKIYVKDKGIGINDADLPYIFEPFYRADVSRSRLTGGYGLGLSICKKIMDAHKAGISVKSTPNVETEFTLVFNKQD
jgi:signal transduction histidine kinase